MADGIFTFDLVDQAQASPADARAKDDSDIEEVGSGDESAIFGTPLY